MKVSTARVSRSCAPSSWASSRPAPTPSKMAESHRERASSNAPLRFRTFENRLAAINHTFINNMVTTSKHCGSVRPRWRRSRRTSCKSYGVVSAIDPLNGSHHMQHRVELLDSDRGVRRRGDSRRILLQSRPTAGQRPVPSGRTTGAPPINLGVARFEDRASIRSPKTKSSGQLRPETENVEWVADVAGVGWSSPVVWGNRVFITSATGDKPMKPPSLGVDFSNEYLAELQKQGLSSEEINKKLYERDREMPHEIVISLMLIATTSRPGRREMGTPALSRSAPRTHSKNSLHVRDTDDRRQARVRVFGRLRSVRVRLRRQAVVGHAAEVSYDHS